MKFKILLLTTILISSVLPLFSGPYDLGVEKDAYMRNSFILSYWDGKLIDDELDGYIIGYGMNNSFGDDKLFAGISLIYFQFLDEFERIEPIGVDLGLEMGMLIPISKSENLLIAVGYSYFMLHDIGYKGFNPSVRMGINGKRFTFSLGYNFKYGVFSAIGIQQTF